jgi:hypothetical protein
VLEILVTNLFDTKAINAQLKPDGPEDVFPKPWCVLYIKVAMSSQALA